MLPHVISRVPIMTLGDTGSLSSRMTVVRMAVARSEFMSFTPTLAKMAVSEAKKADSSA